MSSHERLSSALSEVLNDVGVNDKMIMKRRKCALFRENIFNIVISVQRVNFSKVYLLGSLTEGSTTDGIRSDEDRLYCINLFHTIHDWADWKPGVINVLMVQDETTSPGYCLLQLLRDDVPLAANCVPSQNVFYTDAKGRVLLKNTVFYNILKGDFVQHGPAATRSVSQNVRELDTVPALRCERWPTEGRRWLVRRSKSGWPTAHLKSKSEKSGCFLVPVSSKMLNGLDDLEWRISTSLPERYLMFSLNNTHMQCYVLMKMLLKSHHAFKDVISSYMCKTTLFHCIENTNPELWQEHNLLLCLKQILRVLYNFVYYKNCPHFIIPENNLIAERISPVQRHNILDVIQHIISSDGEALFDIQIENVGERLKMKLNRIQVYSRHTQSSAQLHRFLSGQLCYNLARFTHSGYSGIIWYGDYNNNNIKDSLRYFLRYYIKFNQHCAHSGYLEQTACSYVTSLMSSTIGSLLASYYASLNRPLSDTVWQWLKQARSSDVSSSRLKLATVRYSVDDINVTESILRDIEQQYDRSVVMAACGCHTDIEVKGKQGFCVVADQKQMTDIRGIVSYCVVFLPSEVNIVPQEMRQEYSRSSREDIQSRNTFDVWMNNAVVDSLSYLYFLQYKTYGRLMNRREQQRALRKLQQVIRDGLNLGHRETALNLLGQCMEQENLPYEAFQCYERSLQVRPRNNAANFHISRLHARQFMEIFFHDYFFFVGIFYFPRL